GFSVRWQHSDRDLAILLFDLGTLVFQLPDETTTPHTTTPGLRHSFFRSSAFSGLNSRSHADKRGSTRRSVSAFMPSFNPLPSRFNSIKFCSVGDWKIASTAASVSLQFHKLSRVSDWNFGSASSRAAFPPTGRLLRLRCRSFGMSSLVRNSWN